jgi:hypothetical protein
LFPRRLVQARLLVVGVRIARVNLYQVVDQQHLDRPQHVHLRIMGVLQEQHGRDGNVPGVLGVVFVTGLIQQPRLVFANASGYD